MRLLESGKLRSRSFLQTVASGVLHAIGIAGAVYATAGAAPGVLGNVEEASMVFLQPPPPRAPDPTPPVEAIVSEAVPKGFQVVPPVLDIPTGIPPVNLSERFDPRDYTGVGRPGGRHDGMTGLDTATTASNAYIAAEVDEAVVPVLIPAPRYPAALRAAAIEGEVLAQYVVDTTGRLEPGSWKVLRASHDGFREAAREAVEAGRFKPARIAGRAVRQLVQQTIRFAIQ
ncbi:MAG TPA: energy transducer TonB [Gemmatimonadales bacterium]|nr:energy transducer TonB [Gemmatimonadales bacterium]